MNLNWHFKISKGNEGHTKVICALRYKVINPIAFHHLRKDY